MFILSVPTGNFYENNQNNDAPLRMKDRDRMNTRFGMCVMTLLSYYT